MQRRTFLASGMAALAAPSLARAQQSRVLKFIPQSDLAVLDPVWTTAYVTRNHGYLVFDTLFGSDGQFAPSPQMAAGLTSEADGRLVQVTLRPGLRWHDGTPVLARDCVASIRRWGKRDTYGQTLMDATDELSAPDDRTIRFRLKRAFPLLATALGKSASNMPAMMPERLAMTDPFKQVTEMVGSGPYRFKADERVAGSLVVYERFDGYVPTPKGTSDWTAGPKVAHFDRVEWHVIQDPATAAAALQRGEVDWWEVPSTDLLPLLRRNAKVKVDLTDSTGLMGCMRLNHLVPPFDNPAIRRALLRGLDQAEFMTAVAGDDTSLWKAPVGVFTPGTPMASDAGLEVFRGPRDYAAVRQAVKAAGYKGEKIVLLSPTDFPSLKPLADVCADMLKQCGLEVDYQAMDWGSVVQRRAKQDPVAQGGWSVFNTYWAGGDVLNPVGHAFLRGQGPAGGIIGWPTSPRLEDLRQRWMAAPDLAAQQAIAREVQLAALEEVPYLPLGQVLAPQAYRTDLSGVPRGFASFWGVVRS